MRRRIGTIVVGGSLTAFLGVLLFAALNPPTEAETLSTSTSFADQLQPGKVLHRKFEVYQRYGPLADTILSNTCYQPERMYAESWTKIGEDGLAYEARGVSTDADGNVYMTSQTSDGEFVYQYANANCDEEMPSMPFTPYSLKEWAGRAAENDLQNLAGLGYEKVGEGDWDGKETAIVEIHWDYVPVEPAQNGQVITRFRLPYDEDLAPTQYILERTELEVENPLVQHVQRWALDAEGNKTLIYEKVVTLMEVIDP